jgi:prevent-host-death family protein
MKTMSAREAKNAFGLMIDTARAEPVRIEKHGRGVVMVISVEEYERLNGAATTVGHQSGGAPSGRAGNRGGTERA